ncbi:hypothetical protein C8R43DRAFT_1183772 [Mycena crocata]|nr:hypothetical protein C8R43DRAFT_1183772 [Mycena crocata]
MTESCGMCAIMPPEVFRYDTVGLPVPSIEIKLRDVPEAGYFSCGRKGATEERGEVCICGPSVIRVYYKRVPDDLCGGVFVSLCALASCVDNGKESIRWHAGSTRRTLESGCVGTSGGDHTGQVNTSDAEHFVYAVQLAL